MSSPDLQTVVIACPHCGTRYQVPYATLGAAGREVQCAQCGQAWHATAEPPPSHLGDDDVLFSPDDESALDARFEAEAASLTPARSNFAPMPRNPEHEQTLAAIKAAVMPRSATMAPSAPASQPVNEIDPALLTRARRAFERRQQRLSRRLPAAQVRRTARLAALVVLTAIVLLGLSMRNDLVRWFPSLAGVYAAMGMPVNVVGLAFEDSRTLTTYRAGKAVMQITAQIRAVSGQAVAVPPVLVALLDENGQKLYEWTVTPQAAEMAPGDVLPFSTELTAPPPGAVKVRLTFADPRVPAGATTPAGTL